MEIIHAVILGIVEGISEFLPISSTGHLILASKLLGLAQTDFQKSFNIAIQLGAILAVVVLYGQRLLLERKTLINVAAAFVPTAVIGLALYKPVKHHLLGSTAVVVWALLLGGIFMIAFERWHKAKTQQENSIADIHWKQAVMIGIIQSFSMVPGVSRAAATIFGGLFLGLNRTTAVEFSFLLAVPTMAAATALDVLKSYKNFSGADFSILGIGLITSFLVAMLSIKFLLNFINKHDFTAFGVYRILIAVMFMIFIGI